MNAPEGVEFEDGVKASADAALWRRFSGTAGEDAKPPTRDILRLSGSAPDSFTHYPQPIIPPDDMRGQVLMTDGWRIGHERLQMDPGAPPWTLAAPSRHYADRLHRFDWLLDLAAQDQAGADRARNFVDHWIDQFGSFHPFYWRAGPLFARCWNWMLLGETLFGTGLETVCKTRLDNLHMQLRYGEASYDSSHDPFVIWRGACALLAEALCFNRRALLDEAIMRLDHACTAQLLPDGGHVSRSPHRLLGCLADLLVLQGLFERASVPVPEYFTKWLPRMAAMLNFFKLPDGALAVFNDGGEARPESVDAVLQAVGEAPRTFSFAMKSGFQKLSRHGLTLLLDAGAAPPLPYAGKAHSGPLGFEFTDGPARLVTSCAFSPEVNLDWQAAVRRTSAHSTLAIAGRDTSPFETFESTKLLCPIGPDGISAKRLEEADEIWLDAQHSGWKENYSLIHRRRLFVSGDGDKLTGEDSIVRPVSQAPDEEGKFISFDIRFHLHPSVTAMMGPDAIHLRCENGAVWRFRTTHPGTRLESSRYLGRGLVEPTEQIVMSGQADPNGDGTEPPNCIRWGFRRETSPS